MVLRVGINGFGRIGRGIFRSYLKTQPHDLQIVHINNLAS
ncbi:MAG: hypothetical protein OXC40_00005, partial [Proteobacteria bacterium]|nr:hypothetical protein [Pseudomonadota bacterium]